MTYRGYRTRNRMTIGKALELVAREYDKAKAQEWIHNPVAWALYIIWKIADTEEKQNEV